MVTLKKGEKKKKNQIISTAAFSTGAIKAFHRRDHSFLCAQIALVCCILNYSQVRAFNIGLYLRAM